MNKKNKSYEDTEINNVTGVRLFFGNLVFSF